MTTPETPDDSMSDWGMHFMPNIDHAIEDSGDTTLQSYWADGNFHECEEFIKTEFPELSDKQLEWIEEFISEI